MCGIFGVISKTTFADLEMFKELGEANTIRGNLGFGGVSVTYHQPEGRSGNVFRFLAPFNPVYVPDEPAHLLLGHVRAPTGGQTQNPREIHPFQSKEFLLAHNGLLLNHDRFPDWRVNPLISVDSQVIVGGIQYHRNSGASILTAIKETVQSLEGQQACWLHDMPDGGVYLWRVMSPIYVGIHGENLCFSSVETHRTYTLLREGVIYRYDKQSHGLQPTESFTYYNPYQLQ
jgi:glucosamine 6-phosphate synthetase-like amidotransferase/phosphosugar isomerase protein